MIPEGMMIVKQQTTSSIHLLRYKAWLQRVKEENEARLVLKVIWAV